MFYKGILRKTTLFIFACLVFIIGVNFHDVSNTDAKRWTYTYALGTNEKIRIYPGKVDTTEWSNSTEALQQRMDESATYQNFSAKTSAYVPLPAIIIKGSTVPVSTPPEVITSTVVDEDKTEDVIVNDLSPVIVEDSTSIDKIDSNITEESDLEVEEESPVVEEEKIIEVEEVVNPVSEEVSMIKEIIGTPIYTSNVFPLVQLIMEAPLEETSAEILESVVEEVVDTSVVSVQPTEIEEVENSLDESNSIAEEEIQDESGLEIQSESVNIITEVDSAGLSDDVESASSTTETEFNSLVGDQSASVISSTNQVDELVESAPVVSSLNSEVREIIFDDFSSYTKQSGQNINSMQLRLSMAGKLSRDYEGEYPWIEVVYETGDLSLKVGSLILDDELSNALNGSFYMFALPVDSTLDQASQARVIVRYHGPVEALDGLYIDSVWIEVDSTLITKEDLMNRGKSDQFKSLRRPEISELVSEKTNFTRDELPLFNLRYESQRNIATRMVRELFGRKLVEIDEVIFDHRGLGPAAVVPEIHVTDEGNITLNISEDDRDKLRPGTYSVEIKINEGGKVYTETFDFQWGILTINPDKTEYEVGEVSNISIGALTPNGNTVCKTNLQLFVTDPDDFVEIVPVYESGLCDGNNVIDVPDFSATYTTNQIGEHEFYLERVDDEGNILSFTTDTFMVTEEQPVSIKREGPTRIYPPAVYPMKLTVESKSDFDGVLVERVPSSFKVFDTTASITQKTDWQELSFDINLSAGESTTVEYHFDAPNISPYLFNLGTAHLESDIPLKVTKVLPKGTTTKEIIKETIIPEVTTEAVEILEDEKLLIEESATEQITLPVVKSASNTEIILPVNVVEDLLGAESTDDVVEIVDEVVHVDNEISIPDEPILPTVDTDPVGSDDEILDTVIDPMPLLAFSDSTNIVFTEHRQWQIASDAVGNMIMFWDENSSIPAGWTCRSCGSGTFFDRFAMGSSTYNTTGGATTHTHTALASVSNTTSGAIVETRSGSTVSTNDHAHTFTPIISSISNLPSYRILRVIEYTDATGEPTDIPTGAIGIFDAAVPTGWTRYSSQDGYYIYGGDTSGNTGGSNSHDHAITGTFGGATGDVGRRGGAPSANAINTGHTHTVTASSTSASKEPPYIEVIVGQIDSTSTPPVGMITMWTEDVPAGWIDVSSDPADPFSNRFVKASTTYGTTGGADSHLHATTTGITSSGPSGGTTSGKTAGANTGADGSHTHPVEVNGFSTDNHLPPYLTVVFGKRIGLNTTLTQSNYRWYVNADVQTPTDPWSTGVAIDLEENEPITATSTPVNDEEVVRLRVNALIENATSTIGTLVKLQYATTTVCSAAGSWTDVGSVGSGEIWRGYNNTGVNDHGTLSSTTLASSTVSFTYEEGGAATGTPNEVSVGGYGEWDFVLQNNGAEAGTSYCFRLIYDDDSTFFAYNSYPQLITNSPPDTYSLITRFDNENATTTLPTFDFFASDPESDDIDYQIQIASDFAFSTVVVDRDTVSNSSQFENQVLTSEKNPFTSGQLIRFTNTTALTASTTYWWRVRGKDPSGSNVWGDWSTQDSFTVTPGLLASGWLQTEDDQFDRGNYEGVEVYGSDQVRLITGSTTGTTTSPAIDFTEGEFGTAWGQVRFTQDVTDGSILYRVEYRNESNEWNLVPDSDLTGNSAGFSGSPINLLSLNVDTYQYIRLVAVLTNSGGTPYLQDWAVDWGYRVETPTISSPFANEKVSTTTPTFTFTTSDPQSDSLTYQIQWSTTTDFSASTTRTSDVDLGFSNLDNGGDTDPFNSGDTILFTMQSGDALTNNETYWWRVRAKDTTGDNEYSFYTEERSFTVDTTVTASTWFQTTQEQFESDVLSGTTGVLGGVEVATTATEMMLVYGEGTVTTPRYRLWNGTAWSDESDMLDINSTTRWAVARAATTREEYVSGTIGANGYVTAQVYSLGVWGDKQTMTTTVGSSATRGFDIAYETLSGDAMIVYCDADSNPSYRIWDGSSWSGESSITSSLSDDCRWIRLASDPVSDEIIVLIRGVDGTTHNAQVWSGTAWGNSTSFGTSRVAAYEGMSVAYEESGGQAIVTSPNGNGNNQFAYNSWNGTAWAGAATQAITGRLYWGDLSSNVGTDELAFCYTTDGGGVYAIRWTGSAWASNSTLIATANSATDPAYACAFENGAGRENYITAIVANTTQSQYSIWNTTTWSTAAQVNTIADSATMKIARTGDDLIIGAFYDHTNTSLRASNWNGSSWTTTETLENSTSVTTSPYGHPYALAARNPGSAGSVVVSPAINFTDGTGPYWDQFSWVDVTPGTSDILYQVQYYDGSDWELIPDIDLAGNSAGTTTSPIDLSELNVSTYGTIRPFASLACDGSSNCPTINDWTVSWAEGITVSGTAQEYDQIADVNSGTVGVAVNGVLQIGKTSPITSGAWSIPNVTTFPGDIVTVFVTGAADVNEAVGVSIYNGTGDITGIELYERHVSIGSDSATTTAVTNENIGLYDFTNTEDIFTDVSTSTLQGCADTGCEDVRIYVKDGSYYEPEGRIVTHDFDNRGTFVAGSYTHDVEGSWDNTGTTTMTGSTVVFTATSTTESIDTVGAIVGSFDNITFGTTTGNGTWILDNQLDVLGDLTVERGTLARATTSINVAGTISTEANGFWTGIGTTTFNGSGTSNWRDLNVTLQNIGHAVIDGSAKNIVLTGNVAAESILIGADDVLDSSASNYNITVYDNWLNQNTFLSREGTVTFVSTSTNRTITTGSDSFYNLTFNGVGGSWSFTENSVITDNDFTIATGTVTLPTATTTVAGSWDSTGGTFSHNNGEVRFTSVGTDSITVDGGAFTNSFYDLRFTGSGSWSMTDSATTSNDVSILSGTVTFPTSTLAIGGTMEVTSGTFNGNSGTVDFYGSATEIISTNNSSFADLSFTGSGAWSFIPATVTALGDVIVSGGVLTLPSTTLNIGGSYTNTAVVNSNNGEVIFDSTNTGNTVDFGSSSLYDVTFNGVTGGWTIIDNATTTNNFTLTSSNDWTLQSGAVLSVTGNFTNSVGGASTTWTGSTLSLETGSYSINTKTDAGDIYNILRTSSSTDVMMWNSLASSYVVDPLGSLYSQDHNAVDGDLYIFGAYERISGTEHWSYSTDFDGTDLSGGSERSTQVRIADTGSVRIQDSTFSVIGTSSATTTISNQGSGTYVVDVSAGTTTAQYYDFAELGITGVSLLSSTTVTTLDNGYYAPATGGGAGLTLSSTTIDANPAKQIFNINFATTTAISAFNVSQTDGTPVSYWWFRDGSGNLYGEDDDNDTGNPGSVRFDDSSLVLTVSGTVYQDAGISPLVGGTCDGVTNVVRVVVEGGSSYDGTCSNVDGTYSVGGIVVTGDPTLTVFLNNASGGEKGSVVTRTPTADITDLDIYVNRVIVRNEDVTALGIANMAVYDSGDDTDLSFSAATGTNPLLTTISDTELYVWQNSNFTPAGTVTLGSDGQANSYDGSLVLATSSIFAANATNTYTIGGRLVQGSGAVFQAASSTVVMTATTTGKSITGSEVVTFHDLQFNGSGGGWNLGTDIVVDNDMTVVDGTVTGTEDITLLNGSLTGNGILSLGDGTTTLAVTNTLGGSTAWTFNNLTLGNGSVIGTTTPVFTSTTTILGILEIANAHFLDAGATIWDLAGTGTVLSGLGTFVYDTSTVRYSGAGANVTSINYYNLDINAGSGSPTYTAIGLGIVVNNDLTVGGESTSTFDLNANDIAVDVNGSVTIASNGTFEASNSALLNVDGDWQNNGTFTGNNGLITFDGSATTDIDAGSSSFSSVDINGTGSFTVSSHATATNAWSLTNHSSFTLDSGQTLAVGGTFSNVLAGAATTWTGSTLALYGGGNYTINASTTNDVYGTLNVRDTSQIRIWNSSSASYSVDPTASLYSQDHANIDGELYVYGAYSNTSYIDEWSYATDFDGTDLSGGNERAVTVNIEADASVTTGVGGTLNVLGTSTASTTVTNQGSGTYSLAVTGGNTNWNYYLLRNLDSSGLTFTGSPTVTSLSYGDIELEVNGGSGITVAGSVIDNNPAKTFTGNRFALGSATSSFNVTVTGSSVSSWRFTNHYGDRDGEAFDSDPDGDPGYVVWDDSAALITIAGNVYSNEGSTASGVCDGSTTNVSLEVAGLTNYLASCNASTGAYSITNVAYSPGDSFVVYIDGETPKAATVSAAPISSISNFDLYENRVIVRHEGVDPLTIDDMTVWDSSDDADIPFTALSGSPDTLTLPADYKLIVWDNKTFTPGGDVTITGGGAGAAYDGTLELFDNATFNSGTANTHTIGGSLIATTTATFNSGTSDIVLTTDGSNRSVLVNGAPFYDLTFNGSGSWDVNDSTIIVDNDVVITSGTVTLPTATSTFASSFENNGGSFTASAVSLFTSTAAGKNIRFGGSDFMEMQFTGTGGWSITDVNATTTGSVIKTNGTLTLPSGQFSIGGDFLNQVGNVVHNAGELVLTSTSTSMLQATGSDLYAVTFAGSGNHTMLDTDLTLLESLTISNGNVSFASGTLSVGGSFDASGGLFSNATGTVLLNATTTGWLVDSGASDFYNLQISAPAGGYTLIDSATTTNNFTIASANSFVTQNNPILYIGGVFTNNVGGSATDWTGSTIVLDGQNAYTINTKSTGGDDYNILDVGLNSDIRMWNSQATTTQVDSTSSLYSQDHGNADGELYIYGDLTIATTTEYWSYATDFDGTDLTGGSERIVDVRHATNSTTTLQSGTLNIVGASSNETNITNQGSGTYSFAITGGTFNANYYTYRNLDIVGVDISGIPLITSISNGDFELAVDNGNLITLTAEALNANASLISIGNRFATTTAITGFNIGLVGTTSSAWTFTSHTGNLAGEAFDIDGGSACGAVRFDDSACLLTQQTEYRWRYDDGGEGVPDSEWFNASWDSRQRVRVDNADATTYSNVAVKLDVTFDAAMRSDFADLRFTTGDGLTPTNHFIESYTASTDAVVWVSVPSLPASDAATLFMYFDNAVASDTSTSTGVFDFADDFEGGSIPAAYSGDTSLFNVGTGFNYERTYGIDNVGNQSSRATDGIFRTDVSVGQGDTLRYFQYVDTGAGSGDEVCTLFGVQTPGTDNENYAVCLEQFGTDRISLVRDAVDNDASGTILASSTVTYATGWYEVEIDWRTDDEIVVRLYKDGSLVTTIQANDNTYTDGGVGFTYWFNNGGWDMYTARPYITTTPTIRFGATQVDGGATWVTSQNSAATVFNPGDVARIRFAVENSGLAITNQQFLLEYAPRGASLSCESVSSGSYATVPLQASCGSSPVCMATSTHIVNNEDTTDLLASTTGNFVTGEVIEDPSNKTTNLDIAQDNFNELEYAITPTENTVDQNLCFRVTNDGTDLDTYLKVAALQLKFDPSFGADVSLNGGLDISLLSGTTTAVSATATVSDSNGYADLTHATATIYRSGAGAACTEDNNSCYITSTEDGTCSFINCSGNSCTLSCTAEVLYHADPTDVLPYEGEEWLAYMEVEDLAAGYDFTSAMGVELITLRALAVDSTINYGALTANSDTGSFNPTTTITNLGNVPIDVDVQGTDLSDGMSSTVPADQQKVATSTFTYSACPTCLQLSSSSPVTLDLNMSKPATTTPEVETDVYWGINVPFTSSNAAHSGYNIFTPIGI